MYHLDFSVLKPYIGQFASGMLVTVEFSLMVLATVLVLAIGMVAMRVSRHRALRWFARGYVGLVRNVPILLWLYLAYFGLASLGLALSGETAAYVAFTFYGTAYVSEIYRGGIAAIDHGQWEATAATGLTGRDAWRYVILPQVLRTVFYPLGNIVVATVLASALVEVVAVPDLTGAAATAGENTYHFFEAFVVVGVAYFVVVHLVQVLWRLAGRYVIPTYGR